MRRYKQRVSHGAGAEGGVQGLTVLSLNRDMSLSGSENLLNMFCNLKSYTRVKTCSSAFSRYTCFPNMLQTLLLLITICRSLTYTYYVLCPVPTQKQFLSLWTFLYICYDFLDRGSAHRNASANTVPHNKTREKIHALSNGFGAFISILPLTFVNGREITHTFPCCENKLRSSCEVPFIADLS